MDFAAFECHDDAAAPGYDVVAAMDWDPDASERLDDALRKASPVFDNWRTKGGIAPTRVIPASTEAFDAYRRHHGGSPQQFKQPRVLRQPAARALLAGEASTGASGRSGAGERCGSPSAERRAAPRRRGGGGGPPRDASSGGERPRKRRHVERGGRW